MGRVSVALWMIGTASCGVGFAVPEHAMIRCTDDSECPEGYRCSTVLQLCVNTTAPDDTPPQLVDRQVTPDVAAAHTVIRAELSVGEPLYQNPKVQLPDIPGASFLLVETDESTPGQPRFVFEYPVSGNEPEGSHEVAAIDLVDHFGNENPSASAGIVLLDFSPPEDPSIATDPPGKTGSADVDVSLSATDSDYLLLGGDLAPSQELDDWIPFVASRRVTLSSGDGPKTLFARFRDRAGNESLGVSATVELDTVAPAGVLTIGLTNGRQAVASGAELQVSGGASGDATLHSTDLVAADADDAEVERFGVVVTMEDGVFSAGLTVPPLAAAAATLRLEATLDDGAHQTTIASAPIAVDDTPPTRLTLYFDSAAPSDLYTPRASTPAVLEIANPGQTDTSDLEMLFAGTGLAADEPLNGNWVPFIATPKLELDATPGLKTVSVTVRDRAHNEAGPETATIILDTDPPTSPSLDISQDTVTTPRVTVTVSAVGADQLVVYSHDISPSTSGWIAVPESGELEIILTASPGPKSINARFRDLAGNESDTVSDAVTFDSSGPVSAPTLEPPAGQTRVKWTDTLTINGTATTGAEIESARLIFSDASWALVGERILAPGTEVFLAPSTGNFTGSVTLQQDETPAGAASVAVEIIIRLVAGSCPADCTVDTGSRSLLIPIDNQPPQNPELSVDEGLAVNFRDLRATLGVENTGETGHADIEVRLAGSGVHPSTPNYDTWIPYLDTVLDATAKMRFTLTAGDGPKVVEVSYRDGAHHVAGPVPVTVDYDTTAPSITTIQVTGGGGVSGVTNTTDVDVTVSATGSPAQARITGSGVVPGSYSVWTDHDFANAIPILLSDGDAAKQITVEIRDQALNEDLDDTASIRLDTTGPGLMLGIELDDAGSGKTHIRDDDPGLLSIWGSANEAGCTIVSAAVLGNTGAGYASLKTLAVPAEVSIDAGSGQITGHFDLLIADLSAYQSILVEVIVADNLSNATVASLSHSNEVGVDLTGPQGIGMALGASQPDPTADRLVQVGVTPGDAISVCFFGSQTLNGLDHCGPADHAHFIPVADAVVTSAVEIVGGSPGDRTIEARLRDRAFNTADVQTTVGFDDDRPVIYAADFAESAALDTGSLNGVLFSWHVSGTVTLEVEPSEYPVDLNITGDIGGLAEIVQSFADAAACPSNVCSVTFDLAENPAGGTDCTDETTYAPEDGLKWVSFLLEDAAGNESIPESRVLRLDRTCPSELTVQPNTVPQYTNAAGTNWLAASSITFFVDGPSSDEDLVGYETRVDGGGWLPTGQINSSFAFSLAEGPHTLEIRGLDLGATAGAPVWSFDVTVDTTAPSEPEVGPDGVTINGDTVTVLITQKAIDPGGATDGSDLVYQVQGGPHPFFTDVAMPTGALTSALGVVQPFFEVTPIAQQQGTTLRVRARDSAGNASPFATVSLVEETTRGVETSSATLLSAAFGTPLGLYGDHLVWSDRTLTGRNVYHSDLGGLRDMLWTTTSVTAIQEEIAAQGRFVAWLGRDSMSDAAAIYFYDLGVDEIVGSGDETFFPSNPEPAVLLPNCPIASAFDFDGANAELAYVTGQSGCAQVDSLYIADTSAYSTGFATATLGLGTVGSANSEFEVAIDHGCVVWLNNAGDLRMTCKGGDDTWLTADDTNQSLLGGECTSAVSFWPARTLDMQDVGGERVVVWTEDGGGVRGLCMWRESTAAAERIDQDSTLLFPAAGIAADGSVYYLRSLTNAAIGPRELWRYDIASEATEPVDVDPGTLGRLRPWGDRVALVRQLDGDDRVELVERGNERQVTTGLNDHLTPDVDGDRAVWISYEDHACGEVHMMERANVGSWVSGPVTRVTTTDCPDSGARPFKMCPQISGTNIIWNEVSADPGPPATCDGDLHGIDISGGPPYLESDVVWITEDMTGNKGLFGARISGDNVIFRAYTAAWDAYLHHFDFSTPAVKPTLATPLFDSERAGPADIDGDRIVYVHWATDPAQYYEIRTCSLGESCATPQTVVPAYNGPCVQGSNEDYCYMKWQVGVRGTTLVWLDNRSVWDADSTSDDIVEYDLYWHEISDTPGSGTKLNSSPWRSTRSQLAQQMVENNGSTAGFWDYARPEIGDGFVVVTSLRKDMQQGLAALPNHREVVRIDLVGPEAGVERTLTHSSAAQSTPAADAMGNVVWQDRRDGAFWQIYWYTD